MTREKLGLRMATHPAAAAAAGKMTVATALDVYFTALAGRSKHAEAYRAVANRHILPALGGHRVDRLNKTQIESWQAALVRDDPEDEDIRRRSQDTANRVLTHLKRAASHPRLRQRHRLRRAPNHGRHLVAATLPRSIRRRIASNLRPRDDRATSTLQGA